MGIELAQSTLILLAGGKSSRFGEVKGLKSVEGTSLVRWQLARFREAGGGRMIVVLGSHADVFTRELAGSDAELVVNPAPERGPFTSLQTGIAASLTACPRALYVLPVDVPAPPPQIWRMLDALSDCDAAVPTFADRGGHPVRLSPGFAASLLKIAWEDPVARLDRQLAALPAERLRRIAVAEPGVRLNLNTAEAWNAWQSSLDKAPAPNNS